jgi:hypothetical protein
VVKQVEGQSVRRTLSSMQTFPVKWLLPALWIAGFGWGTLCLWFDNPVPHAPPSLRWVFLLAWLVGTAYLGWISMRLKRVQADEEAIYVSNYLSEVRIPLEDIDRITEFVWIDPATITIHLLHSSAFGLRVIFIPKFRWTIFGARTVAAELRELHSRRNANLVR